MNIVSSRVLRGPNLHSMAPRLLAVVETAPVAHVAGGSERLAAALNAVGAPALEPDDGIALVPPLVDALQALAGTPVEPGRTWPVVGAPDRHWVLCAYAHEAVAEQALAVAVDAVDRSAAGEPVDLAAPLAALRALVAARTLDPASRALVDAARAAGVPVLRLDEAARRFQFGWGRRQRLVEAHAESAPATLAALFDPGDDGRIPTVAITGTNGKTTTTRLIAHLLRASGRFGTVGTTTTQGIFIGEQLVEEGDCTGYWSARRVLTDPAVDAAVLETARGGMLKRGLAFDRCDVGVVLNVSADHLGLDGVETLADLAVVKGLVARSASRAAVLNADDPRCVAMAAALQPGCEPFWFAMGDGIAIADAQRDRGGRAAWLADDGGLMLEAGLATHRLLDAAEMPITLGGAARHNVANALAAAAAACAIGLDAPAIAAGLRSFVSDPRRNPLRSNRLDVAGRTVIVDYAHNLAAYGALCTMASSLAGDGGRLVGVVTSPGDRREADLFAVGEVCGAGFDELVVYEHHPRGRAAGETVEAILAGARRSAGHRPLHGVPGIVEAFAFGLGRARPGDIVVFTCAGTFDDVIDGIRRVEPAEADRIAAEAAA